MRIKKFDTDVGWWGSITLDADEWPPLDPDNKWMDRPVYRWVYDNCYPGVFFTVDGWILFARQEDAVQFQLVWSGNIN